LYIHAKEGILLSNKFPDRMICSWKNLTRPLLCNKRNKATQMSDTEEPGVDVSAWDDIVGGDDTIIKMDEGE
jgi:hypothetical protein